MAGNAGAGGVILALAADVVYARDGVVLNPHYQTMHLLRLRILDLPAPPTSRRPSGPRNSPRPCQPISTHTGQEHRPDRRRPSPGPYPSFTTPCADTARDPHRPAPTSTAGSDTSTSNASTTNRSNRYRPTARRNWPKCATTSPTPTTTRPAASFSTEAPPPPRSAEMRFYGVPDQRVDDPRPQLMLFAGRTSQAGTDRWGRRSVPCCCRGAWMTVTTGRAAAEVSRRTLGWSPGGQPRWRRCWPCDRGL